MMPTPSQEQFRVTSVPHRSSGLVIFTGVPLKRDSYRINSGKYVVTVKAEPDSLPTSPTIGQHWAVEGDRQVDTLPMGDYQMAQHTYENPQRVECRLPETGEQFIRFIANPSNGFKGIGEAKARALWDHLGKGVHPTLKKDCPEHRERLSGLLSDAAIESLFAGYAKYKNLAYCNWMSENLIPAGVQQRLLKHHEHKSIEAIRRDPYLLLTFGMPFSAVDQLAMGKFSVAEGDPRRLSAALQAAMRKEVLKGHTYVEQRHLRPHLNKLLRNSALVTQAFMAGHATAQYILNPVTGTYHPTAQLLMESVVAKRLLKLTDTTGLYNEAANEAYRVALGELPYPLLEKQNEAVQVSLDNALSCITGGAGTGKTTVLRTALSAYHQMGFEIHPVALSGRAAKRLHESIGFTTMTIAALLRNEPIAPSTDKPNNLLVIDEASMLDIPTMYRLVTHLDPSVRIILTGDPDQLPPIGCGRVLADVVTSGVVANTKLEVVKRQEGSTGIPEYSNLINAGKVPENLTTGAITFHEATREQIPAICTDLFADQPAGSCIMAATKAMVADINKQVQARVNEAGQRIQFGINGEMFFLDMRQGDTVLFTQNNYDKGVQNGTLGVLTDVENKETSYGTVELDNGETVEITQALLDCMQLGYSITLHKAQGSQFPRIIIALQPGRIVDRAWLYTAITRAEAEVHIVGSAADFKKITEAPSHSHRRRSYLTDLLRQGKGQAA